MRGIVYPFSRRPAVRAFVAGAAILVGAFASAAHAQAPGSGNGSTIVSDSFRADETALAVPRVLLPGTNPGVSLPQPLTPSDAVLIRQVLALQRQGDMAGATRVGEAVVDPLLTGSVLADRYLGRRYRTPAGELAAWLERFPDLPDAPAIRALLLRRDPKAIVPPLAEPVASRVVPTAPASEDADAPEFTFPRSQSLDAAVQQRAQAGNVAGAMRLIAGARGLSPTYAALLRAEIAQILFTQNEDTDALRIVIASLGQTATGAQPGLTAYVGGLAAWRLGRLDQARILFEESARAGVASARQRAGAAFWAARAARRTGDAAGWVRWLHSAAEQRGTLHGLLARRILGLPTGIVPSGELIAEADMDAVAATPQGWRAFALLQIGEPGRAAAELRGLWSTSGSDRALRRSLLIVASGCRLTDLAVDLAAQGQAAEVRTGKAAAMPRLQPAGGFNVDPALVYALTRTESNFDSQAVSGAGARGLMQIMPVTAQFIARDGTLTEARLHDPAVNLALGQRYVRHLAAIDGVGNDLLRILASYNAGPGNVLRWTTTLRDGDDPLLLIEAIPFAETRNFVPRVLTFSWIYAARLHVPAPSLDALAAGEFPRFTPDPQERKLAGTPSQPR